MNRYELMKYARKGIEAEIKNKCEVIADSWASPDNITRLEALIAQYREIMDECNKAHDEAIEAEWCLEYKEEV